MIVSEIAKHRNLEIEGDLNLELKEIANTRKLRPNSLGFLSNSDSDNLSTAPTDSCLFVSKDYQGDFPGTIIRADNPKFEFSLAASKLMQQNQPVGVDDTASISASAVCSAQFVGENSVIRKDSTIGNGVIIHSDVFIGNGVTIGENTILYSGVKIYENSIIGADCVIHSGAVIGAPGFGFVRENDEIIGFPQVGRVRIGDRVEIGANTCIDRGSLDDTSIGDDTKIDNLVQIAHNVTMGERVLIAAHVGISGSVVIEDDVVIGGQVGIADHVTIRSGAVLGARSAVFPGKIVRKGIWAGTPVRPIADYKKENALIRSLGRLSDEVKRLKQMLR